MKIIKILVLSLCISFGFAQKKQTKTSQSIKVNKDVVVDLKTNYVEIEIDTWNEDIVEVEAYLESYKLSEEELKDALKSWNLNIDATKEKVVISSEGRGGLWSGRADGDYGDFLKDLKIDMADLPEIPEIIVIPDTPHLTHMPEFPELPELPEGVKTINFNAGRYEKEGEAYLKKWSKKYERKGGKELQKRMEDWARKLGASDYQAKMQKWGEEFGEKFGKDMGKWGEEWAEKMEAWGKRFSQRMDREAEREAKMAERKAQIEQRKTSILTRRSEMGNNNELKKGIKIKMPKKAKLKLNVRHGELKVSSVLHNAQGNISHAFLVADYIDGSETSINVSYSPVVIDTWNLGTLNLNFVDKAQVKSAKDLVLNAKSSNIIVENINNTAIIDGSFGDLTISKLADSFKNLNIVLENSDALINLPENTGYTLHFSGNRSKYNNKPTTKKTVTETGSDSAINRTISINAKFSNVIMN